MGLGVDQFYLTLIPEELFDYSYLIILSTGDPIYATEIILSGV